MTELTITVHAEANKTYTGRFTEVRRKNGYALGWFEYNEDDVSLCFPCIVRLVSNDVITVSDWQAPWGHVYLNDEEDVARISKTGQGTWYYPASRKGGSSDVWRHFV